MPDISEEERIEAYKADVTYGTNNEFGFDYLRDNMKFEPGQQAQRPLHFAIVDEVDSILIDEARTPLIISGRAEESTELYNSTDRIVPKMIVIPDQRILTDPLRQHRRAPPLQRRRPTRGWIALRHRLNRCVVPGHEIFAPLASSR